MLKAIPDRQGLWPIQMPHTMNFHVQAKHVHQELTIFSKPATNISLSICALGCEMAWQVVLLSHSLRVWDPILSSVYCLCIVPHILAASVWIVTWVLQVFSHLPNTWCEYVHSWPCQPLCAGVPSSMYSPALMLTFTWIYCYVHCNALITIRSLCRSIGASAQQLRIPSLGMLIFTLV